MLGFFSCIVAAFANQIEWGSAVGTLEKAIYLNRFYSDFFIALALCIILFAASYPARLASALIALFFSFVYFTQYQSYSVMGTFMQSIALENADHVDLLDLHDTYMDTVIWLSLFILACVLIQWLMPKQIRLRTRLVFALLAILVASLIKNDKHFLDESTRLARFNFYNNGIPQFEHQSPASELADTLEEYQQYLYKQHWVSEKRKVLSASATEFAFQHYEHLGQIDAERPLLHHGKLENSLPYQSLLSKEGKPGAKKNIIVFFVEGLSSRIIQPYSQRLPNLTPNIEAFASTNNIRIDNYYNHTYATYRGLGGQLCSIFPIGRLIKTTRYHCLPHILSEQGYATQFLFSQQSSKTDLDDLFKQTGFQDIQSAASIHAQLKKQYGETVKLSPQGSSITDRELMLGLIASLRQKERSDTPFFTGIYNIETHAHARLFMADTVYQNPNGDNSYVLDTFHNFDKTFGLFWKYFKDSPHAKDTIVVLTSDHATAASRDYLALNLDAPKLFIDQIPFLIYHPDINANFRFDAQSRSSIDFAPTVLNILGVENQKVHFLGQSLFLESAPPVAVGDGSTMWHLDRKSMQWIEINNETVSKPGRMATAVDQFELFGYLADLERLDKL